MDCHRLVSIVHLKVTTTSMSVNVKVDGVQILTATAMAALAKCCGIQQVALQNDLQME